MRHPPPHSLHPPTFILPSKPEPLPHAPELQLPVLQVPELQPLRVWWCKHPVLTTSKPANDPIHNQRFIAESFWASYVSASSGPRLIRELTTPTDLFDQIRGHSDKSSNGRLTIASHSGITWHMFSIGARTAVVHTISATRTRDLKS